MSTVYISLASLPDKELFPTIDDAFSYAKNPDNVFIGLVCIGFSRIQEIKTKRFVSKYKNVSVQFKKIPPGDFMKEKLKVLGISNGRNWAMSMYSDQDYVLQIDSHAMFAKNWEEDLINMHTEAVKETGNSKTVLTGYASSYTYRNNSRVFIEQSFGYPKFLENSFFFDFIPQWTTQQISDSRKYIPCRKFNANFAFSDKEFAKVKSLPDNLVFFEEEIIQTLELFKLGFSLCFPVLSRPIIGHLYTDHIPDKRYARKYVMSYSPNGDLHSNKDFHSVVRGNYFGYLEANKDLVKRYESYAKVNLRLGPISSELYIPKSYEI